MQTVSLGGSHAWRSSRMGESKETGYGYSRDVLRFPKFAGLGLDDLAAEGQTDRKWLEQKLADFSWTERQRFEAGQITMGRVCRFEKAMNRHWEMNATPANWSRIERMLPRPGGAGRIGRKLVGGALPVSYCFHQ